MRKADLINAIVQRMDIDKIKVERAVELWMYLVKQSLSMNENVYLRGFGSFIVKKRATKTARNISKNTALVVPEHYIPAFKPAPGFKKKVKENVKP